MQDLLQRYGENPVLVAREANIYLNELKWDQAYTPLTSTFFSLEPNIQGIFESFADLAWLLQHREDVLFSSEKLIQLKAARAIDYERVLFYRAEKEPKVGWSLPTKRGNVFMNVFF